MSLHKLTAGDGYTYLTRQVAAHDATERGFDSLGEYYSQQGEAPGVWMGRGLAAVPDFPVGAAVTEEQMRALFGQGRHPNADAIERSARLQGLPPGQVDAASRLGKPYLVLDGANMFRRRTAGAYRDHNAARGLPEDTPLPQDVRAEIRTAIATAMFTETYARPPADARELSGHLARISRQATTAVAGYDLTFSPVKSVSTLWAIAPPPIARIIEQAQADAVADTLAWLEDHAAYTRIGAGGVAQVDVHGLIAAAFTHRDSRAGDPDLHTHVAISNKVQALSGRWLALDGRLIYRNNVAASERYNTRLEALLTSRLGVTFVERPSPDGKRAVREIAGGDADLTAAWSSRRAAIDARRAELAVTFQAEHGRPPTAKEAVALAQQANLETRQAKHPPRSLAEQRAVWRAQAAAVLGGQEQVDRYVADVLRGGRRAVRRPPYTEPSRAWVERTADEVIYGHVIDGVRVGGVAAERATWQEHHVRAEAERAARAARIRPDRIDRAVDQVVAAGLAPARCIPLDPVDPAPEPEALRRTDGTSVFTVAGAARYTSRDVLAAEQAILAAADDTSGHRIDDHTVDVALAGFAADGVTPNPGQAQLVRDLITSGRRVQLALAPAGTGKTTAMRALAAAWTAGGGTVVGLAPSAAAAAVLAAEIGTATETLAKIVWHLRGGAGEPPPVLNTIGSASMVIIDEAGMAATADLAALIRHVAGRGGQVRLVGDEQQLAAIGAGGVLRDLARTHGAATLSQVLRFTDPVTGRPNRAEAAASLAIRRGDPAGIGFYIDHGRVHVGDPTTTADAAYTAWATDTANDIDALMLAPTRDLAAALNQRARTHRLAITGRPVGRHIVLADTCLASPGDVIITRHNDRTLPAGPTDYVRNGDRWRIDTVTDDGALHVTHLATGMRVTLPADYAARHVQLGYATTVHTAQGITADTCHLVATGAETRQLLYVGLTRGRRANHLYLATTGDGDPHSIITRDALLPPTPADVLARILARDQSPLSATTLRADANRPDLLLPAATGRYRHAIDVAAEDRYGPDRLAALDAAAEQAVPGLTDTDAWPGLRPHLAALALTGADTAQLLAAALAGRDLTGARDAAAVLDWRLHPGGNPGGPLPWLPPIPAVLAADTQWGPYLAGRAAAVTALADATASTARTLSPAAAPAWAAPIIDTDPDLVADLAVWRAAHEIDDTDRRPTGPPQTAAADARAQRALDARVTRTGVPDTAPTWSTLVRGIDPRITQDPYWPTLAARMAAARRAGIDITTITRQVAARRPLPDEQPAAALWWRIAGHLSPAALDADGNPAASDLRPGWTAALVDTVGTATAQRIMADRAWPALVAAVTDAAHAGWTPAQVLAAAHDLLRGGQPDQQPLRPAEVATALAWRVGMLTDQPTATADNHATADGARDPAADDVPDEPPPDPEQLPPDPEDPRDDRCRDAEAPRRQPPDRPRTADPSRIDDLHGPDATGPGPRPPVAGHERAGELPGDTDHVARERLAAVNAAAEAFYTRHYRDVWAARYVTDRLGADPTRDPNITVGYAPNTWTALTRHLHAIGITDTELLAAGLAARTSTGRLIDRFRDRVVFPIKGVDPDRTGAVETRGFIARRNPTAPDDGTAGPKYLNTPATDLFVKGENLYGLAEHAAALAAGAVPVLVEGPLDALAVTVAGAGRYIGVAPLGTAFTDAQADQLRPYLAHHDHLPPGLAALFGVEPTRDPIIVATDNDPAGRQAAHRAYWHLVARREDPRGLAVPDGKDPAGYLHTHGPAALLAALSAASPLAETLIADHTAPRDLTTIDGRYAALADAADITAARPAATWSAASQAIAQRLQLPESIVTRRVLSAAGDWTDDPRGHAAARLGRPIPKPAPPMAKPSEPPDHRWAVIVAEATGIDATADPHWTALADHLTRAADAGYDVPNRLRVLLAQRPLHAEHPLRELDLRLLADCPDCLPHSENTAERAWRSSSDTHRPPAPPRIPAPTRPGPSIDRLGPRGSQVPSEEPAVGL